jgi:hypothetical protein
LWLAFKKEESVSLEATFLSIQISKRLTALELFLLVRPQHTQDIR